jgi:L-aspartate oxidase
VSPAAHYICGGIKTNEYGETNIANLLAFGECTCTEVHGANRLASNSLLESVVFSSLGAQKAKKYLKNDIGEPPKRKTVTISNNVHPELKEIEAELRKAMWDWVGIIRMGQDLNIMLEELKKQERKADALTVEGVNVRSLELKNMVTVANLVTNAAKIREESRGTHYREDYPTVDDKNWLKHICLEKRGETLQVSFA